MTDTFNGASCVILWSNGEVRSRDATVAVKLIPGGGEAFVQITHTGAPEPVTLPLQFDTDADYWAMRAQVGRRGTLVWLDGSQDCILSGLGASNLQPTGTGTGASYRTATAKFLFL